MTDNHKEIREALNKILPTHYELIINSKTETPCITYLELNNSVQYSGDTLGYNTVQYQIKVWGNSIADLQKYASQIDKALRPLGWVRTSTNELYDRYSAMIQKIMTYQALDKEIY